MSYFSGFTVFGTHLRASFSCIELELTLVFGRSILVAEGVLFDLLNTLGFSFSVRYLLSEEEKVTKFILNKDEPSPISSEPYLKTGWPSALYATRGSCTLFCSVALFRCGGGSGRVRSLHLILLHKVCIQLFHAPEERYIILEDNFFKWTQMEYS